MNITTATFVRRFVLCAIVICLLALLITGCGGSDDKDKTQKSNGDIEIGDARNGRIVTVPVGKQLILTLASNRSTGFGWSVKQDGSPVLAPGAASEYIAPPAGSPPGKGGSEKFTFKAQNEGTQTLQLFYARASDPNTPVPGNIYTVQVTATK